MPVPKKTYLLGIIGLLTVFSCSLQKEKLPIRGFPSDALPQLEDIEKILRRTPSKSLLNEYMLVMADEPHHGGSPQSRLVAEYALKKFKEWGFSAEIEEFEALMPFPITRSVELLYPTRFVAKMKEPILKEDKDSADKNQLPTYNAYAKDGDVTGELVFANYGRPEDYAHLDSLGVDLSGRIVIVKYTQGVRSAKIKLAVERGAIGGIIYSDPMDDGFTKGEVYPKGPWRPEDAVQRGTVLDYAATYPGDPLSPGWGSKKGGKKLKQSEAKNLAAIPVVPLSYGDAKPLLEALGGTLAPNDWKGGLSIPYHTGPGPARVRIQNSSDWQVRTLYNVIAKIQGTTDPDQWILHGNHHDGWVNGAHDPLAGAVTLMESARSFSELMKTGWNPRRTLVFALWDGEEWGLLGSTEWAEYHADELNNKLVAYFNSDTYSKGIFRVGGSNTLETFSTQLGRDLKDPISGKSALEINQEKKKENRKVKISAKSVDPPFFLYSLGSGSDFQVFQQRLGIATLNMGYFGSEFYGTYHSIYDSHHLYTTFLDPGFVYGPIQSNAFSIALLRMSESRVLPFSFVDGANAYRFFALNLERLGNKYFEKGKLDFDSIYREIERLETAGGLFNLEVEEVMALGSSWFDENSSELQAINTAIYQSERDLLNPKGLPKRTWFKNVMYATGIYTGFGADPMPGIEQTIKWAGPDETQVQIDIVANAIQRMSLRVEEMINGISNLRKQ